jgi:hypothetical protein
MRRTTEEMRHRIESLPDHVKNDIIYGVVWDMFGEVVSVDGEYIDTDHKPTVSDLRNAVTYLRDELTEERPELTVKEVIRSGELEISPGHTRDEIIELACECLNAANSWDICGEVLFLGSDGNHYVGTVEFVIAPGNPIYVEQALGEKKDDQEGSADDDD